MSKKTTPSFKYTPKNELPKLANASTTWDLAKLYYKNEQDTRLEADIVAAEKAYTSFASKWSKKDFTTSATALKKALTDYEALSGMPELSRPGRYLSFRTVLNTNDHAAEKMLALLSKRLRKASNQILFFSLTLGKIPATKQKSLLRDASLAHFHYYLERVFLGAKHHLTEAEEKIIRLKGPQSSGMWVDAVEKIVSNRVVTFKGKEYGIPEALETLDLLPTKQRIALWDLLMAEMEKIGEVAEHEFNAIITDVRTEDELRGFLKPYSATALGYEDTEESIESLVSAVSTKGFALSRKFYKLKAAYHGVDQLHYTQKYESIGRDLGISFDQALTIARDVFYGVSSDYGKVFDDMITNGQIDVYPKKGKHGGAFMSASTGHPTHVLLNHVDNFKSLETLAHEMGHAIHAARSATNSPLYDGHSIVTAETASTLFENLLFDAVYEQASEAQKPVLLHDRITRDIATIQRQIAFFNAELEIHTTIESAGAMTNAELRDCMYRHLSSYLGPAIKLEEKDGYSYVYIPHLRYGFYVYTYSYGLLMSTIMAKRLKADPSYAKNIDAFLSAGETATVADIFKLAEIDVTKADTFTEALKNHAADINAFAAYARKKLAK